MAAIVLQVGVTGVVELVLLLVMLGFWVGIIAAVVLVVRHLLGGVNDDRVEELEERVAELEVESEE